jgi:hypothetical protein
MIRLFWRTLGLLGISWWLAVGASGADCRFSGWYVKSQDAQDAQRDHLEMGFDLANFSDLTTVIATIAKSVKIGNGVIAVKIGNLDREGVLGDPPVRAMFVHAIQHAGDLFVNADVCQLEKPVIVRLRKPDGVAVIYVEPMP